MPTGPEESDIYVEPVDGISDDFIRGMDASAVLSVENSGARYYNFDGEEQDVFETLAQAGVNYIRLRVWNDPYDEDGNGYGGGDNDLATAIEIAKEYDRDIQIVLHYTNIENNDEIDTAASNLEEYGVDYDIFGLSYYPFWDGDNENMQTVAKNLMDNYGKEVIIAETS